MHDWRVRDVLCEVPTLPLDNVSPLNKNSQLSQKSHVPV